MSPVNDIVVQPFKSKEYLLHSTTDANNNVNNSTASDYVDVKKLKAVFENSVSKGNCNPSGAKKANSSAITHRKPDICVKPTTVVKPSINKQILHSNNCLQNVKSKSDAELKRLPPIPKKDFLISKPTVALPVQKFEARLTLSLRASTDDGSEKQETCITPPTVIIPTPVQHNSSNKIAFRNLCNELESKLSMNNPTLVIPNQLQSINDSDSQLLHNSNSFISSFHEAPNLNLKTANVIPYTEKAITGNLNQNLGKNYNTVSNVSCDKKLPPPRPLTSPHISSVLKQKVLAADSEPHVQHAMAIHDFVPQHTDELACQKGDKILIEHIVDSNWIYGLNVSTRKLGIIPKSYLNTTNSSMVSKNFDQNNQQLKNSERDNIVKCKRTQELSNSLSPTAAGEFKTFSAIPGCSTYGPRCYTLYDYNSGEPGDLAFSQGEIIRLLERQNSDWLKGEAHDGRQGIFPANFVEIIEDLALPSNILPTDKPFLATALYDYTAKSDSEISFHAGTGIELLGFIDSNWLFGRAEGGDGQFGMVPINYLDAVPTNLPVINSPDKIYVSHSHCEDLKSSLVGQFVVAVHAYNGKERNDLCFREGDRVLVTNVIDDNWLEGRLDVGLSNTRCMPSGIFPINYVQLECELGESAATCQQPSIAEVLYDFNAVDSDELSLKVGDFVTVTGGFNSDWLVGSLNGRTGRLPANYVRF